MITIYKGEIRELFNQLSLTQIDDLENALDRELTEEEFKELVMHLLKLVNYSKAHGLKDFADFANISQYFSEDEMDSIEKTN